MSGRKKKLRRKTSHHYFVRETIDPPVVIDGKEFNELQLVANMGSFSLAFHNTLLPYKDRPQAQEGCGNWEAWDWLYRPRSMETLVVQTEKLVNDLVTKPETRARVRLHATSFPTMV